MTGVSLAEAGARPEAVPGGALPRCPACGYTLAALRGELRAKLASSPLLDAPAFATDVEAAYRALWRDWCDGAG